MRLRSLIRLPLLLAAVVAAMLAFTGAASAATTSVHIKGGTTALTLNSGTAAVLTKNGVKVKPVFGGKASGATLSFPIEGGTVDAKTLAGTINHDGGIRFSAGGKELTVQEFIIDTKAAQLTARVSGTKTRIPLLNLNLKGAKISKGSSQVVISNVRATLTSQAAAALNKTFNVKLFKGGLTIGVAKVTAKI